VQNTSLISYHEWSELEGKVTKDLEEQSVSNADIFVRKLVDATVLRNQLYEHTSYESENSHRHLIYAKPFNESDYEEFGPSIKPPLSEYCAPSYTLETEFLYWNAYQFERGNRIRFSNDALEIAKLLLDHYIVDNEKTFETLYTVFDPMRSRVMFYMKEVSL